MKTKNKIKIKKNFKEISMEVIRKLADCKSICGGTSLVSLYIPTGTKTIEISNMLDSEITKAINIKSRLTRQNVTLALKSIVNDVKLRSCFPETGCAYFAGNTEDGFVNEFIDQIPTIRNFTYRCEKKFCL